MTVSSTGLAGSFGVCLFSSALGEVAWGSFAGISGVAGTSGGSALYAGAGCSTV